MPRLPVRLGPWFEHSGLSALLAPRHRWRGLVVLAYHRIGVPDGGVTDPSLFDATAEEFDAQLAVLSEHADLIAPEELDDIGARRGRAVLLTFDDGYADARRVALPVLQARVVRAAFFIATGFVDRPRPTWWDELAWIAERSGAGPEAAAAWTSRLKSLPAESTDAYLEYVAAEARTGRAPAAVPPGTWCTWDDVRALRDAGMTLGAHTHDHPVLARASAARQIRELVTGMDRLEAETGVRPRWLAYPVGQPDCFDATTRAAAQAAGIELAFSAYGGWNRWETLDRYDVRRVCAPIAPARLRARVTHPALFA